MRVGTILTLAALLLMAGVGLYHQSRSIAAQAKVIGTYRACEFGLNATPESTAACSAPIRAMVLRRDVYLRERDNARQELATVQARHAAELTRATVTAKTQAERKARAQAALIRAPRDPDGLVVCDAECMRERWGGQAAGR